ncbi:MAG: N-acetylmuramoyl-L-alanine amidase [Pseudomonadota bacterium]
MKLGWTPHSSTRHIARVLSFLALLTLWLGGVPSWAASVQEVQVRGDRITVRFDDRVGEASAFLLTGPRRIAIDVQGAAPGARTRTGGVVANIRQGRQEGGTARIVLDLSRPAIVTEGDFSSDGRTLTLQLRTVDDNRFARAAAEGQLRILPPFSYARGEPRPNYSVSLPVPPRPRAAHLPRVYGEDASLPLVVIDAGHGGHDPGAIAPGSGLREKDITLKIALRIRDALLATGRVRVALTREDDRFLVLQERYGIARKLGADLFISIHCDSAENDGASGATVYTLSEVASDKEAARLAARENKADIIAGVDLGATSADISTILIDLTQRETMNTSARFARLLGREADGLIPVKPNFHRMASLVVLKAPDMPSILFETGYISNPSDSRFLSSAEGQDRVAQSVTRAVGIHFATRMAAR